MGSIVCCLPRISVDSHTSLKTVPLLDRNPLSPLSQVYGRTVREFGLPLVVLVYLDFFVLLYIFTEKQQHIVRQYTDTNRKHIENNGDVMR